MDWDDVSTFGVISASAQARWNGSATDYASLYAVEVGNNSFQVYGSARHSAAPAGLRFRFRWSTWRRASRTTRLRCASCRRCSTTSGRRWRSMAASATRPRAPSSDFQNTSGLTPRRRAMARRRVERGAVPVGERERDPVDAADAVARRRPDRVLHTGRRRQCRRRVPCSAPARSSGSITHYRGTLELLDAAGPNRVVNQLDVELYLRGVVPREVSASWGSAGSGAGMNALRAQSVAARSYALEGIALLVRQDVRHVLVPGVRRGGDAAGGDVGRLHHRRAGAQQPGGRRHRHRSCASATACWSRPSSRRRTARAQRAARSRPSTTRGTTCPATRSTRGRASSTPTRSPPSTGCPTATGSPPRTTTDRRFDGIWANKVVRNGALLATAWDFRNAFESAVAGIRAVPDHPQRGHLGPPVVHR